ncbi:MAG: inositol-3-phosphate synthase [Candidatus Thorarchaeota archaeon]
MEDIKVALIGVGNCASALVQGVEFYKNAISPDDAVGLSHPDFAGYHVKDIRFVAAFDVTQDKVGLDLADAIFAPPNNVLRFATVPKLGVSVVRGPTHDGIDENLASVVKISHTKEVDVVKVLRNSGTEIAINLLPGSSASATAFYANACLEAGCAFVNATPIRIASDPEWGRRFAERGIPLVGDDLQDQLGSTIIHRNLMQLLVARGVLIEKSYQLDVGGGTESIDSHYRGRMMKREIKSAAVSQDVPYPVPVVAGSSDYVPFLNNGRESYFYIHGRQFGGAPVTIDIRLEATDGPNAGPVLLDVIRGVKLALKRKLAGPLESLSAYGFKSPPKSTTIYQAERMVEEFLLGKRRS